MMIGLDTGIRVRKTSFYQNREAMPMGTNAHRHRLGTSTVLRGGQVRVPESAERFPRRTVVTIMD